MQFVCYDRQSSRPFHPRLDNFKNVAIKRIQNTCEDRKTMGIFFVTSAELLCVSKQLIG